MLFLYQENIVYCWSFRYRDDGCLSAATKEVQMGKGEEFCQIEKKKPKTSRGMAALSSEVNLKIDFQKPASFHVDEMGTGCFQEAVLDSGSVVWHMREEVFQWELCDLSKYAPGLSPALCDTAFPPAVRAGMTCVLILLQGSCFHRSEEGGTLRPCEQSHPGFCKAAEEKWCGFHQSKRIKEVSTSDAEWWNYQKVFSFRRVRDLPTKLACLSGKGWNQRTCRVFYSSE